MFVWDDNWLASHVEEVIEPELPIVDPHHHLWEREGMSTYLLPDLHADTGAGHNVEATVFMECGWGYRTTGRERLRPVGETETVAADACASRVALRADGKPAAVIKGIVGFADLMLGDAVDEVLDAHEAVGEGLFRGIRHATAFDPDPGIRRTHTRPTPQIMAEPAFRAGVRRLVARGHSFDAWLYHPQITEYAALARAVPEGTLVLDHLGGLLGVGPYKGMRTDILEKWRSDLAELASCPNVNLKVGGIGMVIFGLGFEHQTVAPSSEDLVAAWGGPIRYAIEQFGVERCMFESNFPVDKMSCSYVTLWNAFKRIASDASASEKAALFHDTATRVYRL